VVTLTYGDGRIAVIKNSRRAVYGYDQRLELLGSEGLLQAQNMLENTVVKLTTAGVTAAKPTYFFLERYMPAYAAEWAAFVAAVQGGGALPVTLADGVAALAMAEAATQSARSGQPVRLASVLACHGLVFDLVNRTKHKADHHSRFLFSISLPQTDRKPPAPTGLQTCPATGGTARLSCH
jgi:hypothetical protein